MNDNGKHLINYLNADSTAPLEFRANGYGYLFVKQPVNDDITILYSLEKYMRSDSPDELVDFEVGKDLKYGGFYSHSTGELYDLSYDLQRAFGVEYDQNITIEELQKQLAEEVSQAVSEMIHDDPSLIKGEKLTENDREDIERWADLRAEKAFFSGQRPEEIGYDPSVSSECFNQSDIFAYLKDPTTSIEPLAAEYLTLTDGYQSRQSHNSMVSGLEVEKLAREKCQAIYDNPNHVYHKQRDIANAIENTGAKSVRVTIDKDNKEFTFSTEASTLTRTGVDWYSTYDIKASDRAQFGSIYGKHEDYAAQDIVNITYGKKEIYNRENSEQRARQAVREHDRDDKDQDRPSLGSEARDARNASSELGRDESNTPHIGSQLR